MPGVFASSTQRLFCWLLKCRHGDRVLDNVLRTASATNCERHAAPAANAARTASPPPTWMR
eukprot:5827555-Pleurochrysis_carterae.AAC.2